MTTDEPCVAVLADHAEVIRAAEVRRCRPLRHDATLRDLADQVSASVVAALLRPIAAHLSSYDGVAPAERCVRRLFALPGSASGSRDNG